MPQTKKLGPVGQYIAAQPPHVRPVLKRVRAIIRKAVPGLEEGISYRIPVYKLEGELVIFFAAWKEHYSLYPTLEVAEAFARALTNYEVSRGTIRFPLGDVPEALIRGIVKFRAKLAEGRAKAKAERAKAKRARAKAKRAPTKAAPKKRRAPGRARARRTR